MSKPKGCTCTSVASLMRLHRYERRLLRARRCLLFREDHLQDLGDELEEVKEDRAKLEQNCPLHGFIHPRDLQRSIVKR